jgi:hypothetical protein
MKTNETSTHPSNSNNSNEEETFVQNGLSAIALEHTSFMKTTGSKSCIALPTLAYEELLRSVFRHLLLSIIDKNDPTKLKPVRYDTTKKVFYANDPHDERLIVPLNVVTEYVAQRRKEGGCFGALTNVGTELVRQVDAGATPEPSVFEHNEQGKYIGARINNEFVPADKLTQDGLCLVCRSKATKRCTGCKMAQYCSVDCQKRDWVCHRTICGRLKSNKGDFVISTSEPDPAEIQRLQSQLQAVKRLIAMQMKQH